MDRYFWRMGERWSEDDRPFKAPRAELKLAKGTILLLYVTFAVTVPLLFLR